MRGKNTQNNKKSKKELKILIGGKRKPELLNPGLLIRSVILFIGVQSDQDFHPDRHLQFHSLKGYRVIKYLLRVEQPLMYR